MTLKEASEKLKKGEITSEELTKQYLARIKKINPKINAYITVMKDEAMKAAKESDERRKNNNILSEIDGCPIAVKDNMAMMGTKTTAASKILADYISLYDATVISKLKKAGAVILGKTNLDEFAMGSSTENSAFGVTKNPWDLGRVAGGSSGGSAAAVVADLCLAAIGSDTGGSIRQPASFCGVVGLKPTYGVVSRYGLLAMASSLDQIGSMTKTAEDATILYKIIAGYDEKDSTSVNQKANNSKVKNQNENVKCKIGVPKEYFSEGLEPEVRKIIENSIEILKNQGTEIREISLPSSKYALACYYIIMPVEVSSNLARYDGIKYGFSEIRNGKWEMGNLMEVYFKSRSKGFGAEAKRRIMLGAYTSSAGYIDQYYNKAQKVRSLIKKDFDEAFSEVDFIVGPVAPTPAFKIGEKTADPLTMYLSDIYTIAVNLAGLPAISVPAGFINHNLIPGMGLKRLDSGLPVGMHIIGPQFSDEAILQLAKEFTSSLGKGLRDELPRAPIS